MKYWFRHLKWWIRDVSQFPFRQDHCWTKVIGDREEYCLVCHKEQLDPAYNEEAEQRLVKKYAYLNEEVEDASVAQ